MSTEISSAGQQTIDYMTLLITQLRNQNPLDPMDNQQMAAQLAQFSQLELTEEMNTSLGTLNSTMSDLKYSFAGSLWMAQFDIAKSLLGKNVSFYDTNTAVLTEGTVKKLTFDETTGSPILAVQSNDDSTKQYSLSLSDIEGIQAD